MKKLLCIVNILSVILVNVSLVSGCTAVKPVEEPIHRDYWPTQDWRTSTPEAQGMDSAQLEKLMTAISEGNHSIDSVLIIRHGYVVWEKYTNLALYNRDAPHILYSITKSVTSSLVGIAIDKGYLKSLDEKVVDFFPDKTIDNLDERKRNITLENLLMMTAGFDWNETSVGYTDPRNNQFRALISGNYVQYVLNRPMLNEPGEVFTYNTGNAQLLSAIITKSTGSTTVEFARKYLFRPIGVTSDLWSEDAQGIPLGGTALELTPRDAAKFGYLYLNDGVWDGKQIVPAAWVSKSTSNLGSNYGYFWWVKSDYDYYCSSGSYGQRIYIVPKSDLVCVINSTNGQSSFIDRTFIDNILGSISNK